MFWDNPDDRVREEREAKKEADRHRRMEINKASRKNITLATRTGSKSLQ